MVYTLNNVMKFTTERLIIANLTYRYRSAKNNVLKCNIEHLHAGLLIREDEALKSLQSCHRILIGRQ